jgi:hypothetical protein
MNLARPKWNKEKAYYVALQLLVGMLGSVVVMFLIYLLEPRREVVTVDVTGIIHRFVKAEANLKLPPDQLQKQVQVFGQTLDTTLRRIAREKQLILVPKEAVISGAKDVSQEVEARMEDIKNIKNIENIRNVENMKKMKKTKNIKD